MMHSTSRYHAKHGKGFKILSPKQLLQRLSIELPQVKAGDIHQIIYLLYWAKENTKKVYSSVTNSIKL